MHADCFFSLPQQLRITVWSLCTKSVSYIKYPKACQQGESARALHTHCFVTGLSVTEDSEQTEVAPTAFILYLPGPQ
jgi:hypothetical protein